MIVPQAVQIRKTKAAGNPLEKAWQHVSPSGTSNNVMKRRTFRSECRRRFADNGSPNDRMLMPPGSIRQQCVLAPAGYAASHPATQSLSQPASQAASPVKPSPVQPQALLSLSPSPRNYIRVGGMRRSRR
ncbi:hypothetical protein RB195_016855 [Necator americanus]|uniref:Uncharacterized protein n=1 Tax=Necator americanus TaxID=51031 RepID=A0ABR1C3J9_NECAM